jgi:hypothetical protein
MYVTLCFGMWQVAREVSIALVLTYRGAAIAKSVSEPKAIMAFENYVRDLSYLISGDLSDLTLNFGGKTWQVHKALAICHSKWFQKALTSGLKVRHCKENRIRCLTDFLGDCMRSSDLEG